MHPTTADRETHLLHGKLARYGCPMAASKKTSTCEPLMSHDLKKILWASADRLRFSIMYAAEYKLIILALGFLKYVSDAIDERQAKSPFADWSIT